MTEVELKKLCTLWQKRLRLQDWNVRLQIVRGIDLDGAFGNCRSQLSEKTALIRIVDAADSTSTDTEMFGGRDMEEDLVHELIHLHAEPFSPDDRDSTEWKAIEQTVGILANCIVRIAREDA